MARRHALNLSQMELAERSGVSARSIAAYELGESEPTASKLTQLSKALGVSKAWLMGGQEFASEADLQSPTFDEQRVRNVLERLKLKVQDIEGEIAFLEGELLGAPSKPTASQGAVSLTPNPALSPEEKSAIQKLMAVAEAVVVSGPKRKS